MLEQSLCQLILSSAQYIFLYTFKIFFHISGGFARPFFPLEQNNVFLILTLLDKVVWRQLSDWHLILKTSNTPYKKHVFIHNLAEERKFIYHRNWKTPSDNINLSTRSPLSIYLRRDRIIKGKVLNSSLMVGKKIKL